MRLWKRFHVFSFVLALIVTLGGYIVWKYHTANYRAQARLLVSEHVPQVLFQTVETMGRDDYKRYQSTQQALVTSQSALSAALTDSGVSKYRMVREQADPISWLQTNLKVEFVAGSEVMEISLLGDYPDEVAGIVNAVKKAYVDEVVKFDIQTRTARYEQLKKLKVQYTEMLKERRETLRKLRNTIDDSVTVDERNRLTRLAREELTVQRIRLQLERAGVESRLAKRKEAKGPATDSFRKETEELEETLGGVMAQENVVDVLGKELAQPTRPNPDSLDLSGLQADIALMEDTHRKIGAELEALGVELSAPPRIRAIDVAVPPLEKVAVANWGFR
jgi:hypothetical protein